MIRKKVIAFALIFPTFWATAQNLPEEALSFGYCGNDVVALGTDSQSATSVGAAIYVPSETIETWGEATLVRVNIGYGTSTVNEVEVFLTTDPKAEPFYTQTGEITTQNGWNSIVLETPYKVNGEPFYVGYTTSVTSSFDKPVGYDGLTNDGTGNGDWANLYEKWQHIGKYYGNVCIRLSLTGESLPQNDAEVVDLQVPPYVQPEIPFTVSLYITNIGVKNVNEVTLECSINGESVKDYELDLPGAPIESGATGVVEISGLTVSNSDEPFLLEVRLVSVNGESNLTSYNYEAKASFNTASKLYPRNVVVEEFTGLWCGNCPAGIVAMNEMKKLYGDQGFIGISPHYGDDLGIRDYNDVIEYFSSMALPASVVNRTQKTYPYFENIEYYFLEQSKYPTTAGVTSLTASYDEDTKLVEVSSEVEFSFAEDKAKYAMTYVLIENNMGPYTQTNYFSRPGSEYLEGWSDLPEKVTDFYANDVPRAIEKQWGIAGSVPSVISAVTPYSYTTSLPVTEVSNLTNCEVVAMLLDTTTREVLNSAICSIGNAEAGIDSLVDSPETGVYKVFNLQGVKVLETQEIGILDQLSKGIYIINGKKILKK